MAGRWEADEAGVMLFKPTEDISPIESQLSRFSMSQELPFQSNKRPLSQISGNAVPYSRSDSPSTILEDSPSDNRSGISPAIHGDSLYTSSESALCGYSSDRTDFLVDDPHTPCPVRTTSTVQQNLGNFTEKNKKGLRADKEKNKNVVRTLDFRQASIKKKRRQNKSSPPQKSESRIALDNLHKLVYKERHRWTEQERQMLCILFRFYGHSTDDLTKVFNKIFDLSLGKDKIKPMEDYIRRNGGSAFPFYGKLLSCPLDDPQDMYAAARNVIEEAAGAINVHLVRRQTESVQSSGGARRARSDYTRQRFAKLVQRAKFAQDEPLNFDNLQEVRKQSKIGGMAIPASAFDEEIVNVEGDGNEGEDEDKEEEANEDGSPPTNAEVSPTSSQESRSYQPHEASQLAFRVWDKNSRTPFNPEKGFIAEAHSIWRGALLPPPAPESDFFLFTSNSHLNREGNSSAFVSVALSLIQALNYATNMLEPQFAVVDLSHHTLQEEFKQSKASDNLRSLKRLGQAYWARYKGFAEIMIWGNIDIDAIIFHGPLTNLAATITQGPVGQLLFNWDDWVPKQYVQQLTTKLKARDITLNHDIARAIGEFGQAMGLAGVKAALQHIIEFVQVCIDGWSIHFSDDIHTRASIATSFATTLGHVSFHVQEVIQAFITGLERGLENVEYWSRRSPRSNRRSSQLSSDPQKLSSYETSDQCGGTQKVPIIPLHVYRQHQRQSTRTFHVST